MLGYQLKWCWNLTKVYRITFAVFYCAELLVIASSLMFVVSSKKAVDYAIAKDQLLMIQALYWSVALIFGNLIFKLISTRANELTKMKMLRDVQNQVVEAQMYASWAYIKDWSTGDIQFRIHKDCTEVVQMITQVFPNFTLTIIRLTASLSLLWVMDSRLALIILAITPLFLFSKIFYSKFRQLNKALKTKEGSLSHIINENLKFRMLIKSLGVEGERWSKLTSIQDDILELKNKVLRFSLVSQTMVKATVSTGFLFTFIWGVLGLNAGTISFGTMTAFLQLVGRVQNPMLGLLGFFPSFVSFGVSVERIQEILNGPIVDNDKIVKVENIEKLEIANVSFRYEDRFILNNISLILKKGENTAILGASGRGKTTLIRLLLSVISPQKGTVNLYYNELVKPLNASYRTNFGYVPQGDKLFSGTILDNLIIGRTDVPQVDVENALYNACAEFVYDLPQGLNTVVGESGYGLSEGQAQRIAIARTLLRDSPIWLFDEVTSSLDRVTSQILMERLIEKGKNKIVVFVTHDLNMANYCHHKYYMN